MRLKKISKEEITLHIGELFLVTIDGSNYPFFTTFDGHHMIENEGILDHEDQWKVSDCNSIYLIMRD